MNDAGIEGHGLPIDEAREALRLRAVQIQHARRCDFLEAALLAEAEMTPPRAPAGWSLAPDRVAVHAQALGLLACGAADDLAHAVRLLEQGVTQPRAVDGLRVDEARREIVAEARRLERVAGFNFAAALQVAERSREAALRSVPADVLRFRSATEAPRFVTTYCLAAPEEAKGMPTGFVGTVYSGGALSTGFGRLVVDLMTLFAAAKLPVLFGGDPNRIVGHCEVDIADDYRELRIARGRFSAVTRDGRQVAALMGEGQPLALACSFNGTTEDVDRAKPTRVNGREQSADRILRKARLLSVSIVSADADPLTGASPAH